MHQLIAFQIYKYLILWLIYNNKLVYNIVVEKVSLKNVLFETQRSYVEHWID